MDKYTFADLAPTDSPVDPTSLAPVASGLTLGLPFAPATLFWIASTVGWLVVLAIAVRARPMFARFVAIVLGVHTLASCVVARYAGPLIVPMVYLQIVVFAHFLSLSRPSLRALPYRLLVSMPASFFVAGTFLSLPFSLLVALGVPPLVLVVPYMIAAFGIAQSLGSRKDEIDIIIDRTRVDATLPARLRGEGPGEGQPLRIVQISDPHIGPFMSVDRLREICERAVKASPDLILLTGDYLTMESSGDASHLTRALAPLKALEGRVFACNGNHDHEAPKVVAKALASCGAVYLVDDAALVETAVGKVQIVGMDFHWRDRDKAMAAVCAAYPRIDGVPRIVLLHDPGAFKHLPEGQGDLVLSGHTHGGQLGLLSVGLQTTIIRLFVDMPDHGLWARGRDRLYVHRGTGHYGFPLRLGVPAEESILRIYTRRGPLLHPHQAPSRAAAAGRPSQPPMSAAS